MSTVDQQFIEFIVKSLVGKPDAVIVERRIDEKGVLLELTVDPEDLGRVIGKRGATAQSLRTLLRALGTKNDARYNLKIVDNGEGGHHDGESASSKPAPAHQDDKEEGSTIADNTPQDDNQDDAMSSDTPASTEQKYETSDAVSKARQELEDLDDLDI